MKRINSITKNTVGSRRCEVILNEILIEENDAYLTKRVMSRYNKFRDGCLALIHLKEHGWRKTFLTMWYHKNVEELDQNKRFFIERAYTFLRNCMTAYFRTLIRGHEKECSENMSKKMKIKGD